MEDNKRRKGITFGKRVGCVLMSIALVLSVCFTRSIPSRAAGGSDGPSFTITGIGESRLGLAGYFPGTASVRYFNTITVGVPDGYSISLDGSEDEGAVWEEGSHSFTADELGWTGTTRQITNETLPIWVKGPDGTIYPDDYYYAVFSLIEDAGYSISSLRYDDGAPTISGINTGTEKELSIVDGGTVYAGHTVELTVTDSDLKSVTVNGSAAEITEGDYEMPVATFTLEPQSGTPQTVNIQAEDYAGNTKSWTFTLSADQESDYYNMLSVSGLSGPHTVKNTDYPGIESDTVDIYFTKAITVTAPTGYKIKAGYGGSEWGQSVTYVATGDGPDSMEWDEEQEVFGYTTHLIYMVADEDDPEDPMYMYLNELLIRKGSRFEFIKYDADPPTCDVTDQDDNEVALTEDAEIIARELNVLIQDRYLESVKIDGESVDIDTDGDTPTAEITLTVEKGAPAYRHIEATDLAGNTYSRSFTQLYKALPTLTITMDDEIPYGTDYEPDVDTNSTATPVITYQSVNGDHITDLTEKPTEIGEYRVCATVAETDDYDAYEMEWDYAIVKNDSPSSTVSCEDIYYGETPDPEVETDSDSTEITFYYKKASDEPSAYSTTVPTDAGDYTVRALVGETEHFAEHYTEGTDFSILPATPESSVVCASITIGETPDPKVTTTSDSTDFTFYYKPMDDEPSAYSTTVPTAAGYYHVRALVGGTTNYAEHYTEPAVFQIKKLNAEASIVITPESIKYGDSYTVSISTDSTGTKTIEYKEDGADDSTYDITKPTAVGDYVVRGTVTETESYEADTCTATFSIGKKAATSSISVSPATITYGDTYTATIDTDSDGTKTIEYKMDGAGDDTYDTEQPTAAGTYVARGTIAASATFAADTCTTTFTIEKKAPTSTISVSPATILYGDTYTATISTDSTGAKTIEYKLDGAADTSFSTTKPTAAGTYVARGTIAEGTNYTADSCTTTYTIGKKTPDISLAVTPIPLEYGDTFTATITTVSNGAKTIEYKEDGADDSTYTTEKPVNVGTYVARGTVAATGNYEKASATTTFTINKKAPTSKIKVTPSKITIGDEYSVSIVTDSDGTKQIRYKKAGADDDTYTTEKPTAAGDYEVEGTVAASAGYLADTCTGSFTIQKITPKLSITVDPVKEGKAFKVKLTTDSDGEEYAEILYKSEDADASEYTTTKPTKAGIYDIKVSLPETENYKAITASSQFEIQEKEKKSVVLDWNYNYFYYGTNYSLTVKIKEGPEAGVNVDPISFSDVHSDSGWFKKKPTDVGTYRALYDVKGNDKYKGFKGSWIFSIVYLPAPVNAYTISGVMGNADYYTGDVTISAPEGYGISYSLGDTYEKSLPYDKTKTSVYLKRASDGAMTNAIPIRAVKHDPDMPTLDGGFRDGDGNELPSTGPIYANKLIFDIMDEHLKSVKVNGNVVNSTDNRAHFAFETNLGGQVIEIEAEDEAGNVFKKTILFMAEWMKSPTIPEGTRVLLQAGNRYELSGGRWTFGGEKTIYNGNIRFYVKQDEEGTFSKLQ